MHFTFEGIGRAICIALAKSGAQTFALSKTKENLDALVSEVSTHILYAAYAKTKRIKMQELNVSVCI